MRRKVKQTALPEMGAPAARQPASSRFSEVYRYTLAALSVLVTAAVQWMLNPHPPLAIPLLISLLAVVLAAYVAGRGAGLFVTFANLAVNMYFFATPRLSFAVADPADRWRLGAFTAAGIAVAVFSHRLEGTRHFSRAVLALSCTLLLVIVGELVWFDFENERAAEAWVEHTYQVLGASDELLSIIEHAEEQQRDYLLTGDEQYVLAYRQTLSAVGAATEKLRVLTGDNGAQQARSADVRRLITARLGRLDQGIVVRREKGLAAAVQVVGPGLGARQMDDLRAALGALEAEEHRLLTGRTNAARDQAGRTRGTLTAGVALLVLLLIAAGSIIEADVKKLHDSASLLRRQAELLDKAQSPIIVWGLRGAIEYWNHGAEQLYGIRRQEAVGRSHNELLHPLDPMEMVAIEDHLERDGEWSGELVYHIGGREIIVESHMKLVTESDGRKTVLKTNRDITEEKRARAEIQQINRELEQRVKDRTAQLEASNKELEAFAYSVSHDLRAPLRGIDGWSLALLQDYGASLDQTGQQYLERVRSETQRMGRLIDDLLKLSRLTRISLQLEAVDLSSLARAIASRLREAEPHRRMEFLIQDGLSTNGDGRLLEIVLTNLLSNAAKFTGVRETARIEFGRTNGDQEPALYVRDNGVGFDMAYADTLFGAFQRLHRASEFPGTGIGLATAQRVVRRHGGKIWADARLGEGATFYFTIAT